MRCRQCNGSLEPIKKMGKIVMMLCRLCKLPHEISGRPMAHAPLKPSSNPLQAARATIRTAHPTMSSAGKTALEVALVQQLQESYFAGLRDGVILAYSQDYKDGEPLQDSADDPGEGKRPVGESDVLPKQG